MSMLNIGGDQNDSSYRYKMPVLIGKVEGSGNGIKTVISNCTEIAKALNCFPQYVTKYFGFELGAQSKYVVATERSVVNGEHTNNELQKILGGYIEAFILCPNCSLPEINWSVKKTSFKYDCAACGANGPVKTTHKLASYIQKNHSELGKKGGSDVKESKKGKKGKKDKKNKEAEAEAEEVAEKEDKVVVQTEEIEEEEEWYTDTSKDAQKARKKQEFQEMRQESTKLSEVEKILEKAEAHDQKDAPVTRLKIFTTEKDRDVHEICAEAKRLQLSRGLDEPQKIKAVLAAVIDTDIKSLKIEEEYSKQTKLLKAFADTAPAKNRLLCCVEDQIGEVYPQFIKRIPMVLKVMYDADVVDEEALVSWYETPPESSWLVSKETARLTRKYATPFIEWLQDAEEESEEDD